MTDKTPRVYPEGTDHHNYDTKIYTFVHKDLGTENLTRHELRDKYDLRYTSVSKVIWGERNHTGGWYLDEIKSPKKYTLKVKKYKFVHGDLGTENLTRHELRDKYDLNILSLAKVIRGERNHTGGWYLNKIKVKLKPKPKPKRKIKYKRKFKKDYTFSPYNLKGPKHPQADQKIYKFVHKEHGVRHLTQSELRNRYNLLSLGLHRIIEDKGHSSKGWYLNRLKVKPKKPKKISKYNRYRIKGIRHPQADKKIYKFVHKEHGIKRLSRHRLADRYGLYPDFIKRVIHGSRASTGGWYLDNIKEPMDTRDNTVFKFIHRTHGVEHMTRHELREKYNLGLDTISRVSRGLQDEVRGWYLNEIIYKYTMEDLLEAWRLFNDLTKPQGPEYVYVDNSLDTKEYTVHHEDYGTVTGTRSYIRDNSVLDWSSLSDMITGRFKSSRGWRLLSDER